MMKRFLPRGLAAGIGGFVPAFALLLAGCPDGPAHDASGVSGLTVSAEKNADSAAKGGTLRFFATDAVSGGTVAVTWSVGGAESPDTAIGADGLLTVAADEGKTALNVKATSTVDGSKSAGLPVAVTPQSNGTGLAVSAQRGSAAKGGTLQFSAFFEGTEVEAPVTWSISPGGKSGTRIDETTGALTVAANETLSAVVVKAECTANPFYGTLSVPLLEVKDLPSVTGVTVSVEGGLSDVRPGEKLRFFAEVAGENHPSQAVLWSMSAPGKASGTTMSPAGLLVVAADETLKTATVKATSIEDGSKSAVMTAAIFHEPGVSAVTVTGGDIVERGKTLQFTAAVAGKNAPPQDVTWSIANGGVKNGTTITPGGLLTVAADETLTAISVKAVSEYDPTKSGTKQVTISSSATVSTVTVTAEAGAVKQKGTLRFSAQVTGTAGGTPDQAVTWSITTGSVTSGTRIDANTGVLTVAEEEASSQIEVKAASTSYPGKYGVKSVGVMKVLSFTQASDRGALGSSTLRGIAYGNGKFVAVGSNNKIAYSTDNGDTWAAVGDTKLSNTIFGVAYGGGNSNEKFVAVAETGAMAYSTDGIAWTQIAGGDAATPGASTFGNTPINGITWGNGKFVAAGNSGKTAWSENGVNWTKGSSGTTGSIKSVAYGGGKFAAVGTYVTIYSDDGKNWKAGSGASFSSGMINGAAAADGSAKFAAVGVQGAIAWSKNAAEWTTIPGSGKDNEPGPSTFAKKNIWGVAWGKGQFVAAGESGTMAESVDYGQHWTAVNSASAGTTLNGITYGGGRFVAVGNNGMVTYSNNLE